MFRLLLILLLSGCEAIHKGEELICVGVCKHTQIETHGKVEPPSGGED